MFEYGIKAHIFDLLTRHETPPGESPKYHTITQILAEVRDMRMWHRREHSRPVLNTLHQTELVKVRCSQQWEMLLDTRNTIDIIVDFY